MKPPIRFKPVQFVMPAGYAVRTALGVLGSYFLVMLRVGGLATAILSTLCAGLSASFAAIGTWLAVRVVNRAVTWAFLSGMTAGASAGLRTHESVQALSIAFLAGLLFGLVGWHLAMAETNAHATDRRTQ